MPKKLTHEEFIDKLYKKNEYYRNGDFIIVGKYDGLDKHIMVKDALGYYSISANNLLKRNAKPSIFTVINKTEYFKKEVFVKNKYYREGKFEIIGEYLGRRSSIKVLYQSAIYNTPTASLLSNYLPKIKSVKDKTLFWIEKFKNSRDDFNNIDYSNVVYKSSRENANFICKIHNLQYSQRFDHHLNNVQGCIRCMKYPIMYNKDNVIKHKNFLETLYGFLYIIRLKSKEEDFYKVGITGDNRIEYRFTELEKYYEISFEYLQAGYMVELFNLEQFFLKDFENKKYIPKIKFKGYTECLTTNPVAEYYHWFNNK